MNYKRISTEGSADHIIEQLISEDGSVLIIPPGYEDRDPEIDEPDGSEKMIGLFSSGSTGRPKCIWNSFQHLLTNALRSAEAFNITKENRLLLLAAPWHVAGISWALMAEQLGNEYKFIKTVSGEATVWLDAINSFHPDHLLTVPAVLRNLYDEDWFVENIIYGGSPLKYHELTLLHPHSKYLYQGYGQTEAGGLITIHAMRSAVKPAPDEHLCCGQAIEGVEIFCSGTHEAPVKIMVRSETAFRSSKYDTGDNGYMDTEGNIYITGRREPVVRQKDQ